MAPTQDLRKKNSGVVEEEEKPTEEIHQATKEEEKEEVEGMDEPVVEGLQKKKTRRAAAK